MVQITQIYQVQLVLWLLGHLFIRHRDQMVQQTQNSLADKDIMVITASLGASPPPTPVEHDTNITL